MELPEGIGNRLLGEGSKGIVAGGVSWQSCCTFGKPQFAEMNLKALYMGAEIQCPPAKN